MKKIFSSLSIIALLFITSCNTKASINITKAYSYATSALQKNGAIFMNIENTGNTADQLIAAENADIASRIELHTHNMEDGMMAMYQVEKFDIKKGKTSLEPSGNHIMLIGLKKPLKVGDTIPLTLTFSQTGKIDIVANVITAGTKPE